MGLRPTGPILVLDHGALLPSRPRLDIQGSGITAGDDPTNNKTVLTVAGGGTGAGGWSAGQMQFDPCSSPYNAVGDGSTDDTAALQACINAAKAVNGNVNIYKPHKISGALTADRGLSVSGIGMAIIPDGIGYMPKGRIIQAADADVFTFTGRAAADVGFHVRDIGITTPAVIAGNYNTRLSSGVGIRFRDCVAAMVERCTIFGTYDNIKVDGSLTSWWTHIRDCELGIAKHSGITVEKGGTFGNQLGDLWISGCQITNGNIARATGAGCYIQGVATVYLSNCDSVNWQQGLYLAGVCSYNYIQSWSSDTCPVGYLLSGQGVIGTILVDSYSADNTGGTAGIQVNGAQFTTIRGGQHGGYYGTGISVDASASQTDISGVQFWTWNGFSGIPTSGPTNAIALAAGASKFQIARNRHVGGGFIVLGGSHTYGLIEPNNTGMTISGSTAGTGNSMANGPY